MDTASIVRRAGRILAALACAFLCLGLVSCYSEIEGRETGTEIVSSTRESHVLSNCGGPAALRIVKSLSRSFSHDVVVQAGADAGINRSIISAGVALQYGVREGQSEVRTIAVEMTAPEFKKVVYEIEWREIWKLGILYAPALGNLQGSYRYRADVGVAILGSREEPCP